MISLLPFATVLIDPQSALFAGTIIPLIMFKLIRHEPEIYVGGAVKLGAAWGFGYTLAVSYMYFRYPDWMYGYLVDTQNFPLVPMWFVFLAATTFSGAAGAAVGAHLVKNGRMGLAFLCVLAAVATYMIVFIPTFEGYRHMGTLAEWKAGTAPLMPGRSDAAFGMNLATVLIAVPSISLIVVIVRRSQKI